MADSWKPQSYKHVKALTFTQLKKLCTKVGLQCDGMGRDALEILLCERIGISSTGAQKVASSINLPRSNNHCLDHEELQEFQKFTPTYVQALQG